MKLFSLCLAVAIALLSGCKKDEEEIQVEVSLKAPFGYGKGSVIFERDGKSIFSEALNLQADSTSGLIAPFQHNSILTIRVKKAQMDNIPGSGYIKWKYKSKEGADQMIFDSTQCDFTYKLTID